MLSSLERVQSVVVLLLTDQEVVRRFIQFVSHRDHVSSPKIDAQDIHRVVREVIAYDDHMRECLDAHINGKPLLTRPHLDIPALT